MYKTMILGIASIFFANQASADWLEIVHMQLNDGCTAQEMQSIADKLTKKYGEDVYSVEIMTNQHGAKEDSVLWIGRSPSAAVWGKANDLWASEAASGGESAGLIGEIWGCGTTVESGSWRTVSPDVTKKRSVLIG